MRFFWTIIWGFILSFVITYVLRSMAGETIEIAPVFLLTAIFSIAIFVIGEGILKDESK